MTQDQRSTLPMRRDSDTDRALTTSPTPSGLGWSGKPAAASASLSSYLNSFLRHKWLILFCTLLGVGTSYLIWTQVRPTYQVDGRMWIPSSNDVMGGDRGPIVTGELLRASSWVDLLRSRAVLDTVVLQERLYLRASEPENNRLIENLQLASDFQPGRYRLELSEDRSSMSLYKGRALVDQAALGDSIGKRVGILWRPAPEYLRTGMDVDFRVIHPTAASASLMEKIDARVDLAGSFIRLEYADTDPDRATLVINRVMDRTVAKAAELKDANLDETVAVLERQMETISNDLAAAESALETFKIETITLPSEQNRAIQAGLQMTRDPVFGAYFDMRVEEEQTRIDRERLEAALASFSTSGISEGSLAFIPAAVRSADLTAALASLSAVQAEHRALTERYTAEHPEVRAAAERIRNLTEVRIPAVVSELVRQLREQEAHLNERLAQSGQNLSLIPARTIEEARLERRVANAEVLYQDLTTRYQEQSLAQASSIPDLRILDYAVAPTRPSNDQRLRLIAIAIAAFLGLGLVLSILIDRFDPRLRTPQELIKAFGLTVLGVIPRIRRSGRSREIVNVDQVREAFRELRTGIDFAYGFAGPIVLTVTSSGASEGKTLISSNLGVSFSELKRSTLVIDADTRRGTLHTAFGLGRRPGLTDFLNGHASLDDVIQSTDHAGLDIISMGTLVAESPELLSSPMMRELLAAVRQRYEVIIVDSPPLGAGADPLVLSVLTGNLLMVVRSGSTEREFTQAKLEPLGRLPVRFLGVVLNDYIPDRLTASRYYAAYLPGYQARSEDHAQDAGYHPDRTLPGYPVTSEDQREESSWAPKATDVDAEQPYAPSGKDESESQR